MRCASDTLTSLQPTKATRRTIDGSYIRRRSISCRNSFTRMSRAGVRITHVRTTRREKPAEFFVTNPTASRIPTMTNQRTTTPIAKGSVGGSSCVDSRGLPRGSNKDSIDTRIDSTTKKLAKRMSKITQRPYRRPTATMGGPTASSSVMRAMENPLVNVIGSVMQGVQPMSPPGSLHAG